MKRAMKKLLLLLPAVLLIGGCLERDLVEGEAVFSVDFTTKHLDCDSRYGAGLLVDTLRVTSNRSWSAEVENGSDWLKLDTTGFQNLAKVSRIAYLPFHVDDNDSSSPRVAKIVIHSEGKSISVDIHQDPWSPRLLVETPLSLFDGVSGKGASINLEIVSNTSWKVKSDPNDEAALTFSQSSGNYSAKVEVNVAPNTDKSATKTATITISADGCRPIDIPVVQKKGE